MKFLAAFASICIATSALAQTVRLDEPVCPTMSFPRSELASLLGVELAVHRLTLVDTPSADVIVRYDAVECGVARSPVLVVIARGDSREMLQVSSASPRALALYLAELLRAQPDAPPIVPPAPEVPADSEPIAAAPEPPAASLAPSVEPRPAVVIEEPRPDVTIEQPSPAPPPDRSIGAGSILGAAFFLDYLGNPLNQSWLVGLRAELALRLPPWRHLRFHLDGGFAMGRSDWAIHLGAGSIGAMIGIAFGSADWSIEIGPRASFWWIWGIAVPQPQIVEGNNGAVGIGGVVRGQVRVHEGLSLVADVELGGLVETWFVALGTAMRAGGGVAGLCAQIRAGVMID